MLALFFIVSSPYYAENFAGIIDTSIVSQFVWILVYLTPGHAYLTHLAVDLTLSNANRLRDLCL